MCITKKVYCDNISTWVSSLGAHLEGPFISVEKRGAHPMQYLKEMEEGFETVTKTYGSLENVALVTLAPELKNSSNVIQQLSSRNIKVAIGEFYS